MSRMVNVKSLWNDTSGVPEATYFKIGEDVWTVGRCTRSLNIKTGDVGLLTSLLHDLNEVEVLSQDEANAFLAPTKL